MDSERWERIQSLFHDAADRPASDRRHYLETAADGDQKLIADVLAMLEQDAGEASLLHRDIATLASDILQPTLTSKQFGPYLLRELLGEGGMGVVYLAEREDLGNLVAIKILRDAWMSPARRDRFAAEQRTLAQLTHPAIARLYDADSLADGTPWFAMEYVEGFPITDYCKNQNSSIEERLRLVREVCEAVRYAHSRAFIHRDLKPANIFVQTGGQIKLLDFGIARHLDSVTDSRSTRTGLQMMTPAYAAPEQLRGEPAGTYSDVYALGVILYELLTGKLPDSPSPAKPSTLGGANKTLSWPDLDVLCLKALHPDPERRYHSADALIRDLDHYLAGEPIEARPDTARYRISKFVRRNRGAVAATILVALTIAGLIIFYTNRLAVARNAALAEAARTQRILRFTLSLLKGGDKEVGPAADMRVTSLIERGTAEAHSLDRDPGVQAELYETLGEVYQTLGMFDRADSLLNTALERRRAFFGADHPMVAESLVSLGLLRIDEAKLPDAERLVRQGLEIDRRTLPPGHPSIAAATQALGKVLEERGSYDAAIPVLNEAVRYRSTPDAPPADLASSLLELANCHFYAGHYAEAEALNQRLLVMHRQIYGERHPLVAEVLINLGAIQQDLGHYVEAEQYHREALAITRAFYGGEHYKTASNLTLVARALAKQERAVEAAELLQKALAIQEKVFGEAHPRVASAVNEIGTVALLQGNYAEAAAMFQRMAAIYKTVYSGKHYLIGIATANLGSVYMAQGDNVRAEALFRDALAMYAKTLASGHINVGITSIKLGRVLLRQKRFKEAEPASLSGYQIVSTQTSPSVKWLQSAREDLAAIYTALGNPEEARKFETARAFK